MTGPSLIRTAKGWKPLIHRNNTPKMVERDRLIREMQATLSRAAR